MTALDPVASRSPDRTGVCRESRGAPSERKMTIGHGFPSGNQPDEGADRDLPYQFRLAIARSRQLCHGRGQPGGAIWGIPAKRFFKPYIKQLTKLVISSMRKR